MVLCKGLEKLSQPEKLLEVCPVEGSDCYVPFDFAIQQDYVDFQVQMEKTVATICQLLGSKSTTDISEAIDFFVTASEFGLRNALVGVRRMLVLIWSRDSTVRDAVVEAYKGLYLDPPAPNQR